MEWTPRKHWVFISKNVVARSGSLVKKFEFTSYICDKPRLAGWTVSEDMVTEVHYTMTSERMQTSKGTAEVLDISKTTVLKILRSVLCMFPYRYQLVQMFQTGDKQLYIDFANEFLIRYNTNNDWPLRIVCTELLNLLRSVLHMFPRRYQRVQMLYPGDKQLRIIFASEFLIRYDVDKLWPFRILWTDETHFNFDVNTKNCVYLTDMNPHTVTQVPLFDAKITMWYGITTGTVVLAPYFFDEATPTGFVICLVTASSSTNMLQNYIIPEFIQKNALNDIVWMQDGAPLYIAKSLRSILE